jgi:hypothetical protein
MAKRKTDEPSIEVMTPEEYVMAVCVSTGQPCKKGGRPGTWYKCTDAQGIERCVCVPKRVTKKKKKAATKRRTPAQRRA